VFADFPANFGGEHGIGDIRVDVHEAGNEIVASCDLPGFESKEDVHIELKTICFILADPSTDQTK